MAVWSTVDKSALSTDFRFDAEYYRPEVLTLRRAIEQSSHPARRLEELAKTIINFGAYSLCNEIVFESSGVRFITAANIHDGYIDFTECRHISPEQHKRLLWKSQVSSGQVLVAMAARLGYAAVYEGSQPLNSSQDIAKVTLKDTDATQPFYVAAFINSRLGREQLLAAQTGSVQQHTNLGRIKDLQVVVPPPAIQQPIADAFKEALHSREKSLDRLAEAEALLTSALGLDQLDLTPRLYYERRCADGQIAGRFDAEYFNPRMQNLIAALSRDGLTIASVAKLSKRRFKPVPGTQFQYIEIADVTSSGTAESSAVAGEGAPSRATWIVKPNDIITTTVRPIRRLSAIITDEQDGHVCTSGFGVLTPKNIAPELLLVYLRLPLVCELLDLYTTASMYPAIATDDLMKIPIALPDEATRQKIAAKVRDSFDARREARRFLDEAKTILESAILAEEPSIRESKR